MLSNFLWILSTSHHREKWSVKPNGDLWVQYCRNFSEKLATWPFGRRPCLWCAEKIVFGRQLPTNTKSPPNVGLMLGQRRRRWISIKPTFGWYLMFAEFVECTHTIVSVSQSHHFENKRIWEISLTWLLSQVNYLRFQCNIAAIKFGGWIAQLQSFCLFFKYETVAVIWLCILNL